jgi:hypothetical protein
MSWSPSSTSPPAPSVERGRPRATPRRRGGQGRERAGASGPELPDERWHSPAAPRGLPLRTAVRKRTLECPGRGHSSRGAKPARARVIPRASARLLRRSGPVHPCIRYPRDKWPRYETSTAQANALLVRRGDTLMQRRRRSVLRATACQVSAGVRCCFRATPRHLRRARFVAVVGRVPGGHARPREPNMPIGNIVVGADGELT